MVLADTSVWINHFRRNDPALAALLNEGSVVTHPFVVGEIACGNLKQRTEILDYLQALPAAVSSSHDEAMRLIESRKLWGCGIGWVDAHLLASALLTNCSLWTRDIRLDRAAAAAGVKRHSG